MRRSLATLLALTILLAPPVALRAADAPARKTYELKYKFTKGSVVQTKVTHQVAIKTQVKGKTQTATTLSISTKVWRITDVDDAGNITMIHSVEAVTMKQKISERAEVRYDSQKDKTPPPGFESVGQSIGKPLTRVTFSPVGKIINRVELLPQPNANKGQIVMILPDGPIAVGASWKVPREVKVKLKGGSIKKIQTQVKYTLKEVKDGIAEIAVDTQILTPIHNPEIEVQVIQHFTNGTAHFDIAKGLVSKKVIKLDKRVVNFSGEGTFMQYRARFSEEILSTTKPTASKPGVGGKGKPRIRR